MMNKRLFIPILVLALSVVVGGNLMAADIYVNASTGNDTTGDGSSGTPYKTFHKGYTEASNSDRVILMGTFDWTDADETGDAQYDGYVITKSITILGYGIDNTIIQAASAADTADRRIFTIHDVNGVKIEGLTMRYGKVTAAGTNFGSQSIYCSAILMNGYDVRASNSDVPIFMTIEDCKITNNIIDASTTSPYYAGTLSGYYGGFTIIDTTISNNSTSGITAYSAGGIAMVRSYLNMDNCAVTNNSMTDPAPAISSDCGGGIMAWNFNIDGNNSSITNSTIAHNSTNCAGGGLFIGTGEDFYLTNATVAENTASLRGGGIQVSESSTLLYIKNSIVANNTDSGEGYDFHSESTGYVSDAGYNFIEVNTGATWGGTTTQPTLTNLNLSSTLADNGTGNDTQTLAITTGSIAENCIPQSAGGNTYNGCPGVDQRICTRPTGSGTTNNRDAGAFEIGAPLAIDLVSFTAKRMPAHVKVQWETAAELNTTGFHVWRADARDKEFIRVSDYLIPAVGGAFQGAEYLWLDTTALSGVQYWYKLEDVSDGGLSTYHGPVRAVGKRPGSPGR